MDIPVEGALRDRWPKAAVIEQLAGGPAGRSVVHRLDLGGRTAVWKGSRTGGATLERAALAYLDGRVAPALLAEGPGWILMEDLGREAPSGGEEWLEGLGEAVGEVHRRTVGLAWGQPAVAFDHAAFRWHRAMVALPGSLALAGCPLSAAAAGQLRRAIAVLERPRALRVLSHGDLCPENTRIVDGRVRILDWEACGLRHAAFDRYPGTACWLRSDPRAWTPSADARFTAGWQREFPAGPADERGEAAAAVAWAAVATHNLATRLTRDAMVGAISHRTRIVRSLRRAGVLAASAFPGLARSLTRASLHLGTAWGVPDDR